MSYGGYGGGGGGGYGGSGGGSGGYGASSGGYGRFLNSHPSLFLIIYPYLTLTLPIDLGGGGGYGGSSSGGGYGGGGHGGVSYISKSRVLGCSRRSHLHCLCLGRVTACRVWVADWLAPSGTQPR